MSRRSKIVIAALIVIALIAFAIWLVLSRRGVPLLPDGNQPATNAASNAPGGGLLNSSTTVNVNATTGAGNVNAQEPPPPPDPTLGLKHMASAFAERYGSFSSFGDFENQTDLEVFMSTSFARSTENYVAAQRAKPRQSSYRGTTTRALSVAVDSLDEAGGHAVLTVKTQRQEFAGDAVDGTVTYQDIKITCIKESGDWKVDSAVWQ